MEGLFRLFENLAMTGWMIENFEKSAPWNGGMWHVRMSRGHLGEMAFGTGAYPEDAFEDALNTAQSKEITLKRKER